jgi:hypothetical protein
MLKHEGLFTLVKSLENLPFEKQEAFLKSQRAEDGDVVIIRKGTSFAFDVVEKAKGGVFTPEVAKKDDEDTIGDEGHATHPRGTDTISKKAKKSEEYDLEKTKQSKKLLKWRKKQPEGTIMDPSTFEEIKKKAAATGATDPEAVAGAAYWKTAKAKYKESKKAKKDAKKAKKIEMKKTMGEEAYKAYKSMKKVAKLNKAFDKFCFGDEDNDK